MHQRALALTLLLAFSTPFALAEEAPDSVPTPVKLTEAEQKKFDERRKNIEEKRNELNGSSWELTLGLVGDPNAKGVRDTFTFQDGKFKSEGLSKRGFAASNYSISLPSSESEPAVWETMQTGKEGLIFIRGEWEKDKMQGTVSEQLDGGKKVNEYYFSTAARTAIPPSSSKEETPAETKPQESGSKALVSKEKEPKSTVSKSK